MEPPRCRAGEAVRGNGNRRGGRASLRGRRPPQSAPGANRRFLVPEEDQAWFDAAAEAGVPLAGGGSVPLFRKAFTHRSAAARGEPSECNERLEFLGDSVISAVVSEYIYTRFPDQNEGFLTDMRSKLVRGKTLAMLAEKTGLTRGLARKDPGGGADAMDSRASGAEFDPAHEDLFESVVGAFFLDSGYAATAAWILAVVEQHVDVSREVQGVVSSRSALQREIRSLGISKMDVEVTRLPGGSFKSVARCDGAVVGVGEAGAPKLATERACRAARGYLGVPGARK